MASWRAAGRRRSHLTLFYLMVSLGGAVGGIFVALIAPRVFHIYLELPGGTGALRAAGRDRAVECRGFRKWGRGLCAPCW